MDKNILDPYKTGEEYTDGIIDPYANIESKASQDTPDFEQPSFSIPALDALFEDSEEEAKRLILEYNLEEPEQPELTMLDILRLITN